MNNTSSIVAAQWLSRVLAAIFLLSAVITGFFFAATAFRDPDTCFLLALGKWIIEHHRLGFTDPFTTNISSFVRIAPGAPLVQYQWLAQVIFYACWMCGGSMMLMLFLAAATTVTYYCIPYKMLSQVKVSPLSFIFPVLCVLSSSLRFLARPELFSNLFMALLAVNLLGMQYGNRAKRLRTSLYTTVIMALWSNIHALFPGGIILLALRCVSQAVEQILEKKWDRPSWLLILPLLTGLIGTLINPWGIHLWIFEYKLLISPIQFMNVEQQPPTLNAPDMEVFYVLLAVALFTAINSFRRGGIKRLSLIALAQMLLGCSYAFKFHRTLPFGSILMAAAVGELILRDHHNHGQQSNFSGESESKGALLWKQLNERLTAICPPDSFVWASTVVASSLAGVILLYTTVGTPALPPTTKFFTPPFKAIKYLSTHPRAGQILNEGLFGDIMEWYMPNPPNLFVDGRYSYYELDLINDYRQMIYAVGPWKALLDKYNIDSVFVPPHMPLVTALKGDKDWSEEYRDSDAVIIRRLPGKSD